MAYTHSKHEVIMSPQAASGAFTPATTHYGLHQVDLAVTTQFAHWGPGMVPHLVRGVAVVVTTPLGTTATGVSAGVAKFEKIANSYASGAATTIKSLVFGTGIMGVTTPVIAHMVTQSVEILPGQSVRMNMSTVATAGTNGIAVLYVEPRWETIANLPGSHQTT